MAKSMWCLCISLFADTTYALSLNHAVREGPAQTLQQDTEFVDGLQLAASTEALYEANVRALLQEFEAEEFQEAQQRSMHIAAKVAMRNNLSGNLRSSQVIHSNLGGHGPDAGEESLRYYNINAYAGRGVDLVVIAKGNYTPSNSAKNGFSDNYGVINLATQTDAKSSATFKFMLVYTGTVEPVEYLDTNFTIFSSYDCSNEVGTECADTATPAPTPTPCPSQSCEIFADPHVSGFDNLENQGPDSLAREVSVLSFNTTQKENGRMRTMRVSTFSKRPVDVNAYENGDFWLVKSEPIHIQGRFRFSQEFVPDRAAVGALAVGGPFINGHTLLFEPLDGSMRMDGNDLIQGRANFTYETPSFPRIHIKQSTSQFVADGEANVRVEVHLPSDVKLRVDRFARHLDVRIDMPPVPSGMDGECGNYNGNDEDDAESDVQSRMSSLTPLDTESLFSKQTEFSCEPPLTPMTFYDWEGTSTYLGELTPVGSWTTGLTITPTTYSAAVLDDLVVSDDVVIHYPKKSSWTVTLSVEAGEACGRDFYFSPVFGLLSQVITSMTSPALAGATEISVKSAEGFAIGDQIEIGGNGVSEQNVVKGFGSLLFATPLANSYDAGVGSTLLLATPLANNYDIGDVVTKVNVATTTTTMGIKPKLTTTTTSTHGGGFQNCTVSGECDIWGDPHIIGFDLHEERLAQHPLREAFFRTRGWKADQVSIQEEGTFWLVKSSNVHIQGRYESNKTHPEFTSLGALAVGGPFLDFNTLVIRPMKGNVEWNNEPILNTYPSMFSNKYLTAHYHNDSELVKNGQTGPGIDVSLPNGVQLTVNRWNQSLAVKIRTCKEDGMEGQCGNFNHDYKDDVQEEILSRTRKLTPQEFLIKRASVTWMPFSR